MNIGRGGVQVLFEEVFPFIPSDTKFFLEDSLSYLLSFKKFYCILENMKFNVFLPLRR